MSRLALFFILAMSLNSGLVSFVSAHAVSETISISITDDGFVPARVTVHNGTTVVWKNDGKKPHWPASGVHPTHSAYPEHSPSDCSGSSFDACRGLASGESFSFTFNRVGVWSFHDHLNPSMMGVVEVVEDADKTSLGFFSKLRATPNSTFQKVGDWIQGRFGNPGKEFGIPDIQQGESIESYVREEMSRCQETGGKSRCYEAIAKLLMKKHSLDEIMHEMLSAEQYPVVYNRCHELTHFLAREAYKKNKSVPESYGMCTEACWGGCYHGVMEQYFSDKNFSVLGVDDDKIAQEMTTICGTKKDYKKPGEFSECLHGLGHAMMFITNEDLPKSLRYCDLLGGRGYAETCYGGVFMENSSSSTNRDHPSTYVNPKDPLYPCDSLDKKYLSVCYRYQSSYFSHVARYNWEKVSEMCKLEPEAYQRQCFNMIGSNQVGFTSDYAIMRADCALLPGEYVAECIQGAVGSIGFRFKSEPERMLDFCSKVSSSTKESCYTQVGRTEFSLRESPTTLKTLCKKIAEQSYENACLKSILGSK